MTEKLPTSFAITLEDDKLEQLDRLLGFFEASTTARDLGVEGIVDILKSMAEEARKASEDPGHGRYASFRHSETLGVYSTREHHLSNVLEKVLEQLKYKCGLDEEDSADLLPYSLDQIRSTVQETLYDAAYKWDYYCVADETESAIINAAIEDLEREHEGAQVAGAATAAASRNYMEF